MRVGRCIGTEPIIICLLSLNRAGKYDHNPVLPYDREGYSYSELAYHRKRVSEMVQHLRKRYPQTQIMWKPAHLRSMNAHTGKAGEGMTGSSDVEQINQSTRILMHKLGVPVLECKSRPSTQLVRQLTSSMMVAQGHPRSTATPTILMRSTGKLRAAPTSWRQTCCCITFTSLSSRQWHDASLFAHTLKFDRL